MKKKLILRESANPRDEAQHSEAGYEALRAAVLEGMEFHADKVCGLATLVASGMCAWMRLVQRGADVREAPPVAAAPPCAGRQAADYLATLLANLVEPDPPGKSARA